MGNIFSISLPCDAIVSGCWNSTTRRAEHVRKLEENLEALKTFVQELESIKNDVKRRVAVAEENPFMKRSEHVQWWMSSVEATETEVNQVVNDGNQEIEKLCCGGYCSKNYMSSYSYGKKVANMLVRVADLKSNGVFENVAHSVPAPVVSSVHVVPTVGMESMLDNVWRHIEDEQVGIIGVYGMGGVGKTTLLTQINNKLVQTRKDFSLVIWVVVSQNYKLESIQALIGKRIGLSGDTWMQKEQHEKAEDILRVLSEKKFVLFLDDIWEQVDIAKIGLPNISGGQNKSKIVFTTRFEEVCGRMDAHKKIKVECLAWDKAWELFQQKVGKETLVNIPPDIAQTVAKECGGLPLSLITVGRAMACKKTPQAWNYAIQVLKKDALKFSGMEKVFSLLKFTYDNLPSEKVKSCFLYFALFPQDCYLYRHDISYCWMCEEILHDNANVEEAQNESYDIIDTLLSACLLEAHYEGSKVKMHDVIRDMALWLACDTKKIEENFLVDPGANLVEVPNVEKWKSTKRVSLMDNHIEYLVETPESPNLLTLILQGNNLKMISEGFFDFMPNLKVMDLSRNKELTRLPPGVSKLVSLQHLSLSRTGIRELPVELKALIKLKYLDLECTSELEFVPPHIISSFSMLKVLRMRDCGVSDELLFVSEKGILGGLHCLKHIDFFSLTIRSSSCFEQYFLSSLKLVACTKELCLRDFDSTNVLDISSLANMKCLDVLRIEECTNLEELKMVYWEEVGRDPIRDLITINKSCFVGLQRVFILNCRKLKDLTWLIFAPNLVRLIVEFCSEMDKIINLERLGGVEKVVKELNPFAKITRLSLSSLTSLQSIYENALPFPYLKEVHISDCPELKKLPLDTRSAQGCNLIIQGEQEWWNGLEWEDHAARNVFLHCVKEG